jgi:predicted RNA-binding Zn-ribbon protein involved in translation (DUF1610 family)
MNFGWIKTFWLWISGKCPLCGAKIEKYDDPRNLASFYYICARHCGYTEER